MNRTNIIRIVIFAGLLLSMLPVVTSCDDTQSYAELLTDENHSVNRFLADNKVYTQIPADSVFEYGEDAPYYCLDEENSIYMQVINPGDGEMAKEGQTIYFRYMRYALSSYYGTISDSDWAGNSDNMLNDPSCFKFDDQTDYNSQLWGTGIQQPLKFLRLNCDVNIVIKSTYGPSSDLAYVIPYLWRVRYFKSAI